MDDRHADTPVVVTGKLIRQELEDDELESWLEGDARHGRGLRERQLIEWSDPRLPATKITVFNYIQCPHPAGVTAVFEGTHILEDDDGSWLGTSTGIAFPDGSIEGQDFLLGRGAYQGLFAILHARAETAPGDGGVTSWRGVILAGSPPPSPQPR